MEPQSELLELSDIKRLWMLLHGMYGNPLLDKWRTGKLNAAGDDLGIQSAQQVWLATLQRHSREAVRRAAGMCRERHKQWPPTLPEFDDLCRAVRPEQRGPVEASKRIGVSGEVAKRYRAEFEANFAALKARRAGEGESREEGLPGLLALCAAAIANGSGEDPGRALRRLEGQFLPAPRT